MDGLVFCQDQFKPVFNVIVKQLHANNDDNEVVKCQTKQLEKIHSVLMQNLKLKQFWKQF